MATATSKTITTKDVTLSLSQDEASELATVLARVSGGKHTYPIFCQLIQHVSYNSGKVTGSLRVDG